MDGNSHGLDKPRSKMVFLSFFVATTKMKGKEDSNNTHHGKGLRGELKVRRCIRERRCKRVKEA
jgi:hypothetical protein